MSVSINNNMLSLNVANTFNKNVVGLQNSMNALSSGERINYAGDDPAGMTMSERIRTRARSYNQAHQNVQNDMTIMKMADTALGNISDIASSIREKLVQASDDNITMEDRGRLGAEIDRLISRYDEVVQDGKYGKQAFFYKNTNDYTAKGFSVQYGADKADNWKMTFDDLSSNKLELSSTFSGSVTSSKTAEDVKDLIDSFDTKVTEKIYDMQGKLGSYEQRLGYLSDYAESQKTSMTELDSSIRDTDIAQGMTDFMKYNIRTQTSQLMMAQAGQVPAMVLQLLQP